MKHIHLGAALFALLSLAPAGVAQTPVPGPTVTVSVSPESAKRGETVTYTVTAVGGGSVQMVTTTALLSYTDPADSLVHTVESAPLTLSLVYPTGGAVKNPVLRVTVPTNMMMTTNPASTGITGGSFQANPGLVKVSGSEIPADTTATVTWKMQVQ